MKKLILPVILISLLLSCCSEDSVEYSQDTKLNDIKFEGLVDGVKINFSEKTITLAISRDCPESIVLEVDLPEGAKIIQVSEELEVKTDVTLSVNLLPSEQSFVVQAQDDDITEIYSLNIIKDKTDNAVHLIEQLLHKDGSYRWKHERDERGIILTSKLVNIFNEKNIKTFIHESNQNGFIIKTSFTTYEHKKYNYEWSYENGDLTSYNKQYFNHYPTHHFLQINKDNYITVIEQRNNLNYTLNEVRLKYNDNNRISELRNIKKELNYVYAYDEYGRVISDGVHNLIYDINGNIRSKVETSYYEQYTYNDDGQIITKSEHSTVFNYSYFENGRISRIECPNYYLAYNEDGSYVSNLNHPNLLTTENDFDVNHNNTRYVNDYMDYESPRSNRKITRVTEYDEHSRIISMETTTDNKNDSPITTLKINPYYNSTFGITDRSIIFNGSLYESHKIEYNSNGLISRINNYDFNNEKIREEIFTYTKFGLRATYIKDDKNSERREEYSYEYDSEWRKFKETIKEYRSNLIYSENIIEYYVSKKKEKSDFKLYDSNGNVEFRSVRKYYENGSLKSITEYDADGNIIFSQIYEENSVRPEQHEFNKDVRFNF
jgi:hypothetical protein